MKANIKQKYLTGLSAAVILVVFLYGFSACATATNDNPEQPVVSAIEIESAREFEGIGTAKLKGPGYSHIHVDGSPAHITDWPH